MNEEQKFDAIVIGAGITGGWAAKELTERGLRTLLLDRGDAYEHGDYPGEHVSNPQISFGALPDRATIDRDYPVQGHVYAFEEANKHHFINDRENPYENRGETPFTWIRGGVFGGRSLTWGRQAYRWGPQDFEANAIDGHGIDWPVRYDDIDPWYAHVEKFIGVCGQKEGLSSFPDGEFQKPMEMTAIEKTIKKRLGKHWPELTYTIGRAAILTEDLGDRGACHYCGPCPRGCSTGSYFSTLSSTLPAAEATGKLTVRPYSLVERLDLDNDTGRIKSVTLIDTRDRSRHVFEADIIFMCASTIASAQVLLNSATESLPNGLANSSGVVGKYLMEHSNGASGLAIYLDDLDRYYYGYRPNGTYIPRFRNLNGQDDDAEFVRGYGYQTNVVRLDWREMMHMPGIGASYKDILRKPGVWACLLDGFGECLPRETNRVTLNQQKRDVFGLPVVEISFAWGDNERRMRQDMAVHAEKVFRASGAAYYQTFPDAPEAAHAIHEMGTVRMGLDKRSSALNGWNQSHDHPNLFVTDGAAMVSTAYVNPSLTYMAFTARAAAYAADHWHKNTI